MKSPLAQTALLALIAFFVFANSMGSEFVYDDNRQILMNPLIQQPQLLGKALTSDVWAFKGDGSVSASNYYRPTFVLWMIVNFSLFGANPFGWHLVNVLLHVLVCLLSFALLKRLGFGPGISVLLAAVFAVHPVHVENVSWISGSPDILLSLFFLSSVLFLLWDGNGDGRWSYIASLVFFVLALGTKEIAMLLFPLYFVVFRFGMNDSSDERPRNIREALNRTVPYFVLASLFFVARWYMIGDVTHPVEDAPTLFQSLLSVPSVFLFYLRQSFFPVFLAENYPLRPKTAFTPSFLLSAIASVAVLLLAWRVCLKKEVRHFGAMLFFLPLLPALFIRAFPSEQIVHDRYLYLPLLGLLIVLGSVISELLPANANTQRFAVITSAAIIVLLAVQTVLYNRIWSSSFSLWEYNVKADPSSSSSLAQYAAELSGRGEFAKAISAYDRSLEIKVSPLARMGRARNLIALRRYDEAIDDTTKVIELPNEEINAFVLYQAYEAASIAYNSSGRSNDAETLMRRARERLPIYRAALTDKLAIILYNQGKKDEALNELNSVRDQARRELLPASKAVFFRVGMLEVETGDVAAAKRDLSDFLSMSSTFSDTESLNLRRQADLALARMR